MPRASVMRRDWMVTYVCRECGRVLEVFERIPLSKDGRPSNPPQWRGRSPLTRGGMNNRPTRPLDRSEVPPAAADAFRSLGVWPYRCHAKCGRPTPALVPFDPCLLEKQPDGARVEV